MKHTTADIDSLLALLRVEQVADNRFIAGSPAVPSRVYGGQVLAQALNAASQTVDDSKSAHSIHAYFLRPGRPETPIDYDVEHVRDGRSFSNRRVVASQKGTAIFCADLSFQQPESGLEHQLEAPTAPPPEALESDAEFWRRRTSETGDSSPLSELLKPIERHPVKRRNYDAPQPDEPRQQYWFRIPSLDSDAVLTHQALLAYVSDFGLLACAFLPHPYLPSSPEIQTASLDHAIWFHQPVAVNDYLLYVMDSPILKGARGFCRGAFYRQDGTLVASTAQEMLLRVKSQTPSAR